MSLRTTGTANWTSHCGGNFSFIDTFIREKANLGYKLVAKTHRFACGMKATYFLLGFYIE